MPMNVKVNGQRDPPYNMVYFSGFFLYPANRGAIVGVLWCHSIKSKKANVFMSISFMSLRPKKEEN